MWTLSLAAVERWSRPERAAKQGVKHMRWFYNLKTAHKLTLGFGLCLVLSVVMGLSVMSHMAQMQATTKNIIDDAMAGNSALSSLIADGRQYRLYEFRHLVETDSESRTSDEKAMDDLRAGIDKNLSSYSYADTSDEKEALASAKQHWEDYVARHDEFISLSRKGEIAKGAVLQKKRFVTSTQMMDAFKKLQELNKKKAQSLVKQSEENYGSARSTTILFLVASVLLGTIGAVLVTRYIVGLLYQVSQRIKSLETVDLKSVGDGIDALAKGDVTAKVRSETAPIETDTTDELGQMAQGINSIVATTQRTVRSFEAAQDALSHLLAQVRASSDGIASASTQVSSGNADLAQRTEEQAASLEETASSMEEMTSTVRQNADNSRLANQLAAQAKQVAEEGGTVVADAVSAMNGISEASKRIADIVSVIDEIAFQTNLLALNAAVEAARVGEQGRGFAVVAAEVRNLAGRSATAAKEIKALVQDSVARVQTGSTLVNESGTRLEEIVTAVKKVADVIAEISAASLEQAAGIEQVNKAISQMDQVTQQNAALVEEVSASSQSMSSSTQDLLSLVSKFTVDQRYMLTVQTGDAKPVRLAPTGTTGRADVVASAPPQRRPSKAKLTVVKSDENFEEF
jgi:methyl-accepting chemotaxis protein